MSGFLYWRRRQRQHGLNVSAVNHDGIFVTLEGTILIFVALLKFNQLTHNESFFRTLLALQSGLFNRVIRISCILGIVWIHFSVVECVDFWNELRIRSLGKQLLRISKRMIKWFRLQIHSDIVVFLCNFLIAVRFSLRFRFLLHLLFKI